MSPRAPDSSYPLLLEEVQLLLSEGKLQSRQASAWEKVETYWYVGDAIYKREFPVSGNASYGQRIVDKLSKDIGLGETTLWEIIRFRRGFPKLYTCKELSWSHYRALLRLPNQEQRRFYEKTANRHAWSATQLGSQIKQDLHGQTVNRSDALPDGEDPFAGQPLRSHRGNLYTYYIRERTRPDGETHFLLDLGFNQRWRLDLYGVRRPRDGIIVSSRKHRGSPSGYAFSELPPSRRKPYAYVAEVDRVIDGDSIHVNVHCGFGHERLETLRLRAIDTPELSTHAGQRARQFVTDELADLDFVVITTTRRDKYRRYLAEIFYLPGESDPEVVLRKGVFLNRRLLEERLAVRYGAD